jgi:hypothetical protein
VRTTRDEKTPLAPSASGRDNSLVSHLTVLFNSRVAVSILPSKLPLAGAFMRGRSFVCGIVFVWLLAGGLTGCQTSDRAELTKVRGEVKYQGKPVAQGIVVFYPEAGRSAQGKIVDGQITEVTTFEPNDGAPAESMKVTVVSLEPAGADPMAPRKSLVPSKYSSVESTDLSVDLLPGTENDVLFELDGPLDSK